VAARSQRPGLTGAIIARCHPDGRVILANAGNPAPYLAGEVYRNLKPKGMLHLAVLIHAKPAARRSALRP
jgi:hypothetical protein